jgi:hypothetical protein
VGAGEARDGAAGGAADIGQADGVMAGKGFRAVSFKINAKM